jgi:hypothetical protein
MKKKPIFLCDIVIKSKTNPNITAILRLARNMDFSGFEIAQIIKEAGEDKEVMKRIPVLGNNVLNVPRWNLFCRVHVLKKFKEAGFYERDKRYIWTSVFEI